MTPRHYDPPSDDALQVLRGRGLNNWVRWLVGLAIAASGAFYAAQIKSERDIAIVTTTEANHYVEVLRRQDDMNRRQEEMSNEIRELRDGMMQVLQAVAAPQAPQRRAYPGNDRVGPLQIPRGGSERAIVQ